MVRTVGKKEISSDLQTKIAAMYQSDKVSHVSNIGTLIKPTTQTDTTDESNFPVFSIINL